MKFAAVLLCAFAASLWGCAGQIGPTAPMGDPAGAPAEAEADSTAESIWREQKLIRNGEIVVEVGGVEASAKSVGEIAAKHDGIVADSQFSRDENGRRRASIRVRVPAAQFEPAMADLRGLGAVSREHISTEDVTKAYFDLETRLEVKQKTAARLQDILATRTGSLADVIAAEGELGRVTGEIEQMQGEKRFYDHRIATSTISVSLNEGDSVFLSFIDPIRSGFGNASAALGQSIQFLILLLTIIAPWVVVGLAAFWVVRRVTRKKQRAPEANG